MYGPAGAGPAPTGGRTGQSEIGGRPRGRGNDVTDSQWGGRGASPAPWGSRCSSRTGGGGPRARPLRQRPPQDGERAGACPGSDPRERPPSGRVRSGTSYGGRRASSPLGAAGSAARPPQPRRQRLGSERAAPTREDAAEVLFQAVLPLVVLPLSQTSPHEVLGRGKSQQPHLLLGQSIPISPGRTQTGKVASPERCIPPLHSAPGSPGVSPTAQHANQL